MNGEWTESDLREVLLRESVDVDTPEAMLVRIDRAAPRRRSAPGTIAAAVLLVMSLAAGVLALRPRDGTSTQPPVAALHTAHLSLRDDAQFQVSAADDLGGREVLTVSYAPTAWQSYEGGAVTLYDRNVFDAATFLGRATPAPAAGNDAFFGTYPYTGGWGPVTTLAWRLADGRWVSVQNFRGATSATSRSAIRSLEAQVAAAVIVR